MNVFNKLFTITGLIFLMVLGAVTLFSPSTTLSLLQNAADTIHTSIFANMPQTARFLVRALLAVILVLILLGILWLEVRRPAQKTVEVGRSNGGTTIRISTDAIESKLRDSIDGLTGVIGSKVLAQTRGKAVQVQLDVLATKDTDLVAKAEEISGLTRTLIQEQLGLKLHSKPQIVIKAGAGKAKVDRKSIFPSIGRPGKDKPAAEHPAPIALPDSAPAPDISTVDDAVTVIDDERRLATDS